jgi:hypothetical protein
MLIRNDVLRRVGEKAIRVSVEYCPAFFRKIEEVWRLLIFVSEIRNRDQRTQTGNCYLITNNFNILIIFYFIPLRKASYFRYNDQSINVMRGKQTQVYSENYNQEPMALENMQ